MRQNFSSNSTWEQNFAYSRLVVKGNRAYVSGTTAVDENGEIQFKSDVAGQCDFIFAKIKSYIENANFQLEDTVRIRIFVLDISESSKIGVVMKKYFEGINPAATMVEVSKFIDKDILIEIEVDLEK